MKRLTVLVLLGCCHIASAQAASCFDAYPGTDYQRVSDFNDIITLLNGKRIMATTPDGSEEWNEDHCDFNASGALFMVGVSVNDPVDPRAYRGQWGRFFSGGAAVQYVYSQPNTFSWSLWKNSAGDLCWERISDSEAIAVDLAPLPADIPTGLDCQTP